LSFPLVERQNEKTRRDGQSPPGKLSKQFSFIRQYSHPDGVGQENISGLLSPIRKISRAHPGLTGPGDAG
jgi:hypothetical protein